MNYSKAIVTLAIGDRYVYQWRKYCQQNWQQYAEKYEYDLICLEEPLDYSERANKRSPAWQKCLILSQDFSKSYERIVWVDSDILINPLAPCIVENVPIEKIGAIDQYSLPTSELYQKALKTLYQVGEDTNTAYVPNYTAQDFYKKYGIDTNFNEVVQTGVMVLSPVHHRAILEYVYFNYEDKGSSQLNYEMRPLSYELIKANQIHWIDYRFNQLYLVYMALNYPSLLGGARKMFDSYFIKFATNQAFQESFFIHFAGPHYTLKLVDLNNFH